jgi:hypothetical protein
MEQQQDDAANQEYPLGRGYGHDYMRGGEVFGGYGYAQREEYARPRGELTGEHSAGDEAAESTDAELHRSQ